MGVSDGVSSHSLQGFSGDRKALAGMWKNAKIVAGAGRGGWAEWIKSLNGSNGHVSSYHCQKLCLHTQLLAFCQSTLSVLQSVGVQQSVQQSFPLVSYACKTKHLEQYLAFSKHSINVIDSSASCIFIWNFLWAFSSSDFLKGEIQR